MFVVHKVCVVCAWTTYLYLGKRRVKHSWKKDESTSKCKPYWLHNIIYYYYTYVLSWLLIIVVGQKYLYEKIRFSIDFNIKCYCDSLLDSDRNGGLISYIDNMCIFFFLWCHRFLVVRPEKCFKLHLIEQRRWRYLSEFFSIL